MISEERRERMSVLANFFKGSDTRMGVFYPCHYLVAVFRDPAVASHTAQKLWNAGFERDDAIAVDGQDVIELDKEEKGLGAFVMQAVSRFLATEQKYTDHDLELAEKGAGFLAVYCPTDDRKHAAWRIVKGEDPFDARYYASGAVEHLAGDPKTD
jgi:hypothetical protein